MNQALRYLEHLSDQDLMLMARVDGSDQEPDELRSKLRDRPDLIETLLTAPDLLDVLFNDDPESPTAGSTPFLVFCALVHRTAFELDGAAYVPEWTGPGKRLPVFDVTSLRDFLSKNVNRFFLIELLTSFVRVASGSVWVRTRRGYRRRRFSELDPVQLAVLVEQMPAAQRPAGYRRLGDVVLFLTGIFPDHTATNAPSVSERERLAASAGISPLAALDDGGDLLFHELLGANWYRRAATTVETPMGPRASHLLEVAGAFTEARRFLNVLTDRYLHRFDPGLSIPN